MAWDRDVRRTIGLRIAGLALVGGAVLAGRELFGGSPEASALDLLLALVSFAGIVAGSGLLLLGGHLFDRVAVSERWSRRPVAVRARAPSDRPIAGEAGMRLLRELSASEPTTPPLWTAREGTSSRAGQLRH